MQNLFKVTYDIKRIDMKSASAGLLIEQTVSFPTLQSAIKFVKTLENKQSSKYVLVGRPIIERL